MIQPGGSVPNWDPVGQLPPFVGSPTNAGQRSPYLIGLTDLVLRFGDTATRRRLLVGFLDYRAALFRAGIQNGFQWVNGSFIEDTVQHQRPEPRDLDVVTFFSLPHGVTQTQLTKASPMLFDQKTNRNQYGVDAYNVVLDAAKLPYLARVIVYWNSLWSHDRSLRWKGYLEVDLSNSEDPTAKAVLQQAGTREVEE